MRHQPRSQHERHGHPPCLRAGRGLISACRWIRRRGAWLFSNQLSRVRHRDLPLHANAAEDNPNYRTNSFYPAYPGYDWGVLYGWAWGTFAHLDYVETQPFATRASSSRWAIRAWAADDVATAFDYRIALGAPAGPAGRDGCLSFLRPNAAGGKEDVET